MLKAALTLALTLAATPLHAATKSPAELLNRATEILTQTDAVRYTIIASDEADLRSSTVILRGSVLADISPHTGVVAAKVDATITGDNIPRGARMVLTAGPDGAQLLNYATKSESLLDFADINKSDAATAAKFYDWLNFFINTEGSAPYADDGSARVRGTERVGGDMCDVITAEFDNEKIEFFMPQESGLPVRIDTVDADGTKQFIRINGMRTNVNAPESLFNIKPAPRGFSDATPTNHQSITPAADDESSTTAPAWALTDSTGKRRSSADYIGKLLLIKFFSTSSEPSKRALPGLQRMNREYSRKGLTVICVSVDEEDPQDAVKYMRSHGFRHTLLLDGESLKEAYGFTTLPGYALVAPDGTILHTATGYTIVGEHAVENAVRAALGLDERPLDIDNIDSENLDNWDG